MSDIADPMPRGAARARRVLFLQGPHGPFFWQLGLQLQRAGAQVWRVGFNAGDAAFWPDRTSFIAHQDPPEAWPAHFAAILERHRITDLVLYGDVRPVHAQAVTEARRRGLTVHVFEEGYLRPYWITYERGGSNGNSRLMQIDLETMRAAVARSDAPIQPVPARWGDMRQHIWFGALYHWHVLCRNRHFPHFRPHRSLPVRQEFRLHGKRLLTLPAHALERAVATRRVLVGSFPYHLVLLQLAHDSSFREHGPFPSMEAFLETCLEGFAGGAPRHHHLVFKAHPLEDGRAPVAAAIRHLSRQMGLEDRVHFIRGGKLALLLDHARSAVTVNSTAAQQALLRGLPVRTFGAAVYDKPGVVSHQPLESFFARPKRPDTAAYRAFRTFLLETSQVVGGFYSARGRRQALRQVVDMMLAPLDPYEAFLAGAAPPRIRLHAVG